MTTHVFQSLWLGDRLTPLEQLCLKSFVACDHRFILYSYTEVKDVPDGVECEDARQIVPEEGVFIHRSGIHIGSPAGFSDRFRYELLRERGGWWVDTDVVCLKDEIPDTAYAFAKQDEDVYVPGILKAPRDSELLARAHARAVKAGKDIAFNTIGPSLFNELVHELDLEQEAWPRTAFYALGWDRVLEFFDPGRADAIEALAANSTFVHFSTSMLRLANVLKEVRPPEGSYLDRLYVAHEIEFPAHPRYEWGEIQPQYELEKAHWQLGKEAGQIRDRLAAKEAELEALSAELTELRGEKLRLEQSVMIQLFLKLSDRLYRFIGRQSLPARAMQAALRAAGRMFIRRGAPAPVDRPEVIQLSAVPKTPPPAPSAPDRHDAGAQREPALSVIVPCRNAELHLRQQLEALASQETFFPWELIIVDNGSTDRSVSIAEQYKHRIPLRVVPALERPNQAYARNAGAHAASSEKLIFVDADDEVAPGFLTAMYMALRDHDLVMSPQDIEALNPGWNREAHNVSTASEGEFAPYAFGTGVGLSRRVLESVGGWPEEYTPCEDMALSYRLQRSGVTLACLPEPLLRYRFRDSLRALFRQTRVWGSREALVHRDFASVFVTRRTLRLAISEWLGVLGELLSARSRADLARFAVRFGYSVGRLSGSLRYRTFYL
jgi:glycosyltransferase involved in cell wall biosynthesis